MKLSHVIAGGLAGATITASAFLYINPAVSRVSRAEAILGGHILPEDVTTEDLAFKWMIRTEAERITAGLASERDKALALARWIGTKWRNVSALELVSDSHDKGSWIERFVYRTGACGTRANIYVFMAEAVGLRAKVFSIYNFGHVGAGHTAVQVEWDGKWHFIDVTYAGWFEKDGDVLSFAEIAALGAGALDYLVPIETEADSYWTDRLNPLTWRRVDNRERMSRVYSAGNLALSQSNGFVLDPTPVTLRFGMVPGDSIGEIDASGRDVFRSDKSEQLGRMGFSSVPFFHEISLGGLEPGRRYVYRVDFWGAKMAGQKPFFTAESAGCSIVSGADYRPDALAPWAIELQAASADCVLSIKHNVLRRGRFLEVDRVAFE